MIRRGSLVKTKKSSSRGYIAFIIHWVHRAYIIPEINKICVLVNDCEKEFCKCGKWVAIDDLEELPNGYTT